MVVLTVFEIFIFFMLILFGVYLCTANVIAGIIFILCAILIFGGRLFYIINKKIKMKKQREEFNVWLNDNGFIITKKIGDFLYDGNQMLWCVDLEYRIFRVSDINKATICKNASRTYTSNRTSSAYGRKYHRGGSSQITRRSTDTSTFGVMIQTNILECPVVTIYCGHSASDAQSICTVIKLMLDKLKNDSAEN